MAQNYVYVPLGMPTNPSINLPPFTGTIPADTLSFTVAHEFGHLLNLLDTNLGHGIVLGDPRDIMVEGNLVTASDIRSAVHNSFPNSLKGIINSCGCK
jgi:hypothetical protein